jgi:hypothetical protein
MSYGIYFDSATPPEALRDALQSAYGISPEVVYIGPYEGLKDRPNPPPVAIIIPVGGDFGYELSAGERLAELTGATELDLARTLARLAGSRALVDDGGPAPDYWFLVARDGSYGRVMTDPDNDWLTILYALEPIPGEPDLPVVPPPDWAKTW